MRTPFTKEQRDLADLGIELAEKERAAFMERTRRQCAEYLLRAGEQEEERERRSDCEAAYYEALGRAVAKERK